ncbi:O-methyltransferase [Acinetobacter rathckeae]|uniref:O-methyltransferase n=1 Tax=Acinetobacter rathckeae TaxID=2605272 RepID=UPI0018A28D30|nr:O-methyltransferase [Acinetobacter rathckeae]MBF7687588.1 O-methyltransferase [Acinetobacter rathckeae]MBF7694990.1 O-methyltransferase [Acinetobacter rathckeae]
MQKTWSDLDHYIESHLIPQDEKLQRVIDNTDQRGLSNHLAVAPNQGMLLQMLIQMNKAKRVLEIGTFAAYSTLWLARALPEDGYLLTIEGRDSHAAVAQENINNAQMNVNIELRIGMAAEVLNALPKDTAPFDFIFIDADKGSYPIYLELALQFSHSGSIIVLDNVIRAGDIIDPTNHKPSITGIRDMFVALKEHPKLLSCTALQTVGSKGHDGLAIAIVK